jgi:spore coat protein CotH
LSDKPEDNSKLRMADIARSRAIKLALLAAIGLVVIISLRGEATVEQVEEPPSVSIRIDVGSDHESLDHAGRLYVADQEWTPETQTGHIGGYRVWNSGKAHPTDGTADEFLHTNQRFNWEEYRFSDITNGDYLVSLAFSEIGVPYVTAFDVAIEGQTVLDDFRILDHVGGNYALTRRFASTVRDGELNVSSKRIVGDPRLAAITVESRPPDKDAPASPAGLTATSSYGAVMLDWADNAEDDLDGYHVYRATAPDGPYERVTQEPAHVSLYADVVPSPHVTQHYCISAIDVYGNESGKSPCEVGFALDNEDAQLPLYELEVSPADLVDLYSHALSDEEVSGVFTYEGQAYPVTVRYRGGYGRYVHKKPWNIRFPNRSPFPGRDQINLRADYIDRTLMHTKLATDLFEAADVLVPEAEYVLLTLNGEYQGVYISNEQVDEGFLDRTGKNPNTSIYKAVHTDTNDWTKAQPSEQAYYDAYEKKTNRDTGYDDIISFIEFINNSPDEDFAHKLRQVFDVPKFLDAYAVNVLISNGDFAHHNAYLLHDLGTNQWELVPYDFDVTFQQIDRPINEATAASPIQPREWTSVLLTRVLDVPQFRAYYCHRLAEFMNTVFSDPSMESLTKTNYATIEQDGLRDWHKVHREYNAWFTGGPVEIKDYVAARRAFLRSEMETYCPAPQPYLRINEVMIDNNTTLQDRDEPTEYPSWIEIYNEGLDAVDLGGMYLTDDPANPTKSQIASGATLPPGGFITFIADGDREQGPLHTSFTPERSGGQLGIFSGTQPIDIFSFNAQAADVSQGRHPDGADGQRPFSKPTPGRPNLLPPPVLSSLERAPLHPTSSDAIAVTAVITDDDSVLTATLHYNTPGTDVITVPMTEIREDYFAAQIPPQPTGSLVTYRVLAQDNDGQTSDSAHSVSSALQEFIVDYQPPALIISEFQANSRAGAGEPDASIDWVELYNPGPEAVDLGGRYLTDNLNKPRQFRIADGTVVPPYGFVLFYADNSPEQGPLHTNFRLDRGGESVGLFDVDADGNRPIDVYTFGPQPAGVSEGRCPDSDRTWVFFATPTPGTENRSCDDKPFISKVSRHPAFPSPTQSITITAVIIDDSPALTTTLWYSAEGRYLGIPLIATGGDVYAASVAAPPEGTVAAYYIQAENARGTSVTDPSLAPVETHFYTAGHRPPPLYINEFMADNATAFEDPDEAGEYPDWIELYNAGSAPIDLGGKHLTDDLANPTKYRIPDGITVPGGGFILFFADGDPEQGPLHTNFQLSKSGEEIGLFDLDITGNRPIDTYTFGLQGVDLSERRYPDGEQTWVLGRRPTPGTANVGPWRLD